MQLPLAALQPNAERRSSLRFQQASGQLQNTARVRAVRRDIARITTILASRENDARAKAS